MDKNGHVKKIIDKESISKKKYSNLKFLGEALGIVKLSNQYTKRLRKSLRSFLSIKKNLNFNWEKAFKFKIKQPTPIVHKKKRM